MHRQGSFPNLFLFLDLSPYIIVQEITKQPADPSHKPIPVMMIHYHFNTTSAPPLSPFALNDDDLEVRTMSYSPGSPSLPFPLSPVPWDPGPSLPCPRLYEPR